MSKTNKTLLNVYRAQTTQNCEEVRKKAFRDTKFVYSVAGGKHPAPHKGRVDPSGSPFLHYALKARHFRHVFEVPFVRDCRTTLLRLFYLHKYFCTFTTTLSDMLNGPVGSAGLSSSETSRRSAALQSFHASNSGVSNTKQHMSSLDSSNSAASTPNVADRTSSPLTMHQQQHSQHQNASTTLGTSSTSSLSQLHHSSFRNNKDIIRFNVGGEIFTTLRTTVNKAPTSLLSHYVQLLDHGQLIPDEQGCIFVDREPKYFAPILNFLRTGQVFLRKDDIEGVLFEARHYQVEEMIPKVEEQLAAKREQLELFRDCARMMKDVRQSVNDLRLCVTRAYDSGCFWVRT